MTNLTDDPLIIQGVQTAGCIHTKPRRVKRGNFAYTCTKRNCPFVSFLWQSINLAPVLLCITFIIDTYLHVLIRIMLEILASDHSVCTTLIFIMCSHIKKNVISGTFICLTMWYISL